MSVCVGQTANIESVICDLMKQLEKLAPHPDRPQHKGPLFISVESEFNPPAEYEGMLGSMMLESMLGTTFSEATSSISKIDVSTVADLASEYISDRAQSSSYRLGQKNMIAGAFNQKAKYDSMLKAFYRDLPKRLGLERWISEYQRKLYAMRENAKRQGLALAA